MYTLLSTNPPNADRVFYMDPLTGVFFLRKSLEGTLTTFYNVSLFAFSSPNDVFFGGVGGGGVMLRRGGGGMLCGGCGGGGRGGSCVVEMGGLVLCVGGVDAVWGWVDAVFLLL